MHSICVHVVKYVSITLNKKITIFVIIDYNNTKYHISRAQEAFFIFWSKTQRYWIYKDIKLRKVAHEAGIREYLPFFIRNNLINLSIK